MTRWYKDSIFDYYDKINLMKSAFTSPVCIYFYNEKKN